MTPDRHAPATLIQMYLRGLPAPDPPRLALGQLRSLAAAPISRQPDMNSNYPQHRGRQDDKIRTRRGAIRLQPQGLPRTFPVRDPACPCLSVAAARFLSVRPRCPGISVRAARGVRHICPCDPRPPGPACPRNRTWRFRSRSRLAALSVDPGHGPVRYLSVTTVTTWTSMTADDTG